MQSKMENTTNEPKEFPKLMINKDKNTVVLFYKYGHGQVVYAKEGHPDRMGEHYNSWYMPAFDDFSGTITLTA